MKKERVENLNRLQEVLNYMVAVLHLVEGYPASENKVHAAIDVILRDFRNQPSLFDHYDVTEEELNMMANVGMIRAIKMNKDRTGRSVREIKNIFDTFVTMGYPKRQY